MADDNPFEAALSGGGGASSTGAFNTPAAATAPPPATPAPTQGGGGPGAVNQQSDLLKQLTQMMQQAGGSNRSRLPEGNPQQAPEKNKMAAPPYRGAAAGKQAFLYNIGSLVHNAVAQKKENDIRKAQADWRVIQDAWDDAQAQAGDPNAPDYQKKVQEAFKAHPLAAQLVNDPKKMKNMAKSLQMDWLNPEKAENTIYKQALNRHLPAEEKRKAMMDMQDKMTERISQAATKKQPPPPQSAEEVTKRMTSEAQLIKALDDRSRHFSFGQDRDGNWLSMDTHTGKVARVRDENGQAITAAQKGKDGVAVVNGVPIGMNRGGKLVTPTDPEWTPKDAQQFGAAKGAWAAGEASKERRLAVYAEARAKSWAHYNPLGVVDTEGGNSLTYASRLDIAKNPDRYAPASAAIQMNNRVAIFKEIDATSEQMTAAIKGMGDATFDGETRAKIGAILRDTKDMGNAWAAWDAYVGSGAASSLSEAQINYVTALISMTESAMSLRTVGGMGQGSDRMRGAISRMLPGVNTPSASYAMRQMQLFNVELNALKESQMNIGKPKAGAQTIVVKPEDMVTK